MPEIPEVQAHAERLTEQFGGAVLKRFVPLQFTALKTAVPAPDEAYGQPLQYVGRRGKYLLVTFEPVTFVVHLMQGGRLLVDEKQAAKPRGGQARFVFESGPAMLLTEQGTERKAGVWCVRTAEIAGDGGPLAGLGPEPADLDADDLLELFKAKSMRIHGFLRDQHRIAGIGRRLANEICHRARISPFAMTGKLTLDDAATIHQATTEAIADDLAAERELVEMSKSKGRPSRVHGRTGEACPVCGDTIRAVEYSGYTVNYCATCQTGGKVLADNTTSKFLR